MSTKTIELIEPHEHAGRDYPAGSELTLDTDSADWLIALKKAKPAGKTNSRPADAWQPEPTKENAA
ncbi:DUF7210 family protein [Thiobacillus denitrificans]|uniref:DUF7210 domain-containing protein n=1 Tax=Thiobacillus denitrificans TaxID=36861 RepID=A0A119CYA6_THIDE|nr:hypothetical protein [Thiobacillus denitrificans]KVW99514.1 hypothetical protein ABW22_01465 [Thiobacillus denitrificans]